MWRASRWGSRTSGHPRALLVAGEIGAAPPTAIRLRAARFSSDACCVGGIPGWAAGDDHAVVGLQRVFGDPLLVEADRAGPFRAGPLYPPEVVARLDVNPRIWIAILEPAPADGELRQTTSWSAAVDALAAGRMFDADTSGLVYLDDAEREAQ